ncbi:terpene synthase family protein [Streptomyces sp. KR80]|uniref:terpene synthase family protein n=1 Tax=Streptomyces sp. KR80 TaxID=3457426 RepID=UPI003FD25309
MIETTHRPSAIGWRLPPFYCPIARDVDIHPAAERIEERAVAWIDAFGIYPDATERAWGLAGNAAEYTCRMIPHGDEEPILLFVEWNYWATALDDWHDSGADGITTADITDHSARLVRSLEAPGSAMLPPSPLTTALDDLVVRTRAMLTPFQLRRFADGARDWLFGAGWQTANSERRVMPALNDFAAMRGSMNGTRFSVTFIEVANDIRLPPDVLYSPPVQALTETAGFIVGCDNDLFSYAKEDHLDPPDQNLVNVLAHRDGCSPAVALPAAVAIRDRAMTLFLTLRQQLARGADDELRRYLESLGHYISGFIHGESTAGRYASPRNRNALPVPGARYGIRWSTKPSDPSTEPLPIPALAWWWDQLED